jgi:hypothetical protein
MKTLTKIILFICLLIVESTAQEAIDLSELKPPSSPAFTILGLQPTEIARPKTYEALEASLLNSFFQENNFSLSNNLALEFSPYWLVSHPNLTFERYIDPSIEDNILYSSSLSLGTIRYSSEIDTNIISTDIAIGYRTMIFAGECLKKNKDLIKIIMSGQSLILDSYAIVPYYLETCNTIADLIDSLENNVEIFWTDKSAEEVQYRKRIVNEIIIPYVITKNEFDYETAKEMILQDLPNKLSELEEYKVITEAAAELENANKDNVGFLLEFAAAFVLGFPSSKFQYSNIPKWGIWLTPTYRLENQTFEFIGLLRFITNEIPSQFSDNYDFGAKINYQLDKFALSAECIGRYQRATISQETINDTTTKKISSTDLKTVINVDYRITDNLILTYSFGQDFDLNTKFNNNLISIFSLNFGIGGPTTDSFILAPD